MQLRQCIKKNKPLWAVVFKWCPTASTSTLWLMPCRYALLLSASDSKHQTASKHTDFKIRKMFNLNERLFMFSDAQVKPQKLHTHGQRQIFLNPIPSNLVLKFTWPFFYFLNLCQSHLIYTYIRSSAFSNVYQCSSIMAQEQINWKPAEKKVLIRS